MRYEKLFPTLPDEARGWAYVSQAPISARKQDTLLQRLEDFFETWTSHGRTVRGKAHILGDRILLVAAHVEGGISGCGIDSSVEAVREAGSEVEVTWIDPLNIVFRAGDNSVDVVSRSEFRKLIQEGRIGPDTSVFDLSVTTLAELRSGRFEQPASESWHARVFKIPRAA